MVFKSILIMVIIILFLSSSSDEEQLMESNIDYRQEMRTFVEKISKYAKAENHDFMGQCCYGRML